ncbi:TIGR03564 family F420-dependent LLM class oxidoreductase [Rhizohabitans arisaemae]|uniref:TIGR03564 family F420-dependent LLM class oxidoreductase n=1 Tax=Rhizohabitans arisaemae TaxID=2720610 RepID=UPI0024B23580|nr:TIGR03564 family F420-dependent LLM class oxidoreductase [Rhizohabitans arisaemae]
MRIGLLLDAPMRPEAIDELREKLIRASQEGFASVWMPHIFGLDALTALAVTGPDAPDIELGTAVVPSYPRHPAALAQQALTVDAVVGGRLTLGVGLSHRFITEGMYGYSYDKPIRHMREYLSVLIPLLRGGQVDFDGETVSAHMRLTTPSKGAMQVLIAALAPQMLKLAGRVADGTILWMTGPGTVANHAIPTITAAAEGRPHPRIVCALPVCVTDDVAAARARAGQVYRAYTDVPSYRAMLDREGAAGPADVALVGDEKTVADQLGLLSDAGVTDFVASEFASGTDAVRTREFLRSLL